MLQIIKTDSEDAKKYSGFFAPWLIDDPVLDECVIYFSFDDETDEMVGAAAVEPTMDGAYLRSIAVTKARLRQGVAFDLMEYIIIDMAKLYQTIIDAEPRIIVEENLPVNLWDSMEGLFYRFGMTKRETDPFVKVSMTDINESPVLKAAEKKSFSHDIRRMDKVSGITLRAFGNHIANNGLYSGIDPEVLDPELSFFYMEDEEIKGCILMSRLNEKEVMNEWVYQDEDVKDGLAMIALLSTCFNAAKEVLQDDATVAFSPVNDMGRNLMKKVFPEYTAEKEIRRYERFLTR
ncbi:MAG: hypothetical protein K6A69_08670 [Lachnospiraceae bacterium]|nr:hypothetical protein [Lachnospiraceae bacterium]